MTQGAIAAGHPATAQAGQRMLEEGGNAFDVALAALCAACVCEPVLTSFGGGGFMLAHSASGREVLYDFFVQTPKQKRVVEELDFYPIQADFGSASQEFHIGLGSVATPGAVKGLFQIHRELGSLPMSVIMEPAMEYAREGVRLNALQAYIFSIVAPIYQATPEACETYASPQNPQCLVQENEVLRQPQLAETLEALAREGEALFYQGELARVLTETCQTGGALTMDDLKAYQVIERRPLEWRYRNARLLSNPGPSWGGLLICFAQSLLQDLKLDMPFGSEAHLLAMAEVMTQTNLARAATHTLDGNLSEERLHNPEFIARFRQAVSGHPLTARGTTHISVVDGVGNAASLTLSNGEGCGNLLPGSGIMLNNMLGEEDLNPGGFHDWQEDVRVSSMMAPTLAFDGDTSIVTGSGGSNRLRSAILQTLVNLLDFNMTAEQAVAAPRMHVENGLLSLEPGYAGVTALCVRYGKHHLWDEANLFFGGAHTVVRSADGISGAGDPRRGGVFLRATA